MANFKKQADDFLVRVVCHFARPVPVKNMLALVFLPAIFLAFLWAYIYPVVLTALKSPELHNFMSSSGALQWAEWIALIPSLGLTYFTLYPLGKAVAITMPEKFQEELFDDSAMK